MIVAGSPVRIGFQTGTQQGPGIFLSRLRQMLEARGVFDAQTPEVWVQLSFEALPEAIAQRVQRGQTRVLARMNGCWCQRHYTVRWPCVVPVPWLDARCSRRRNDRKNARIRQTLAAAHGIVYQSAFSRRLTQAFVDPAAPAGRVIYNGVDLDAFSPQGPRDGEGAGDFSDRLNILVSHSFQPYHRLHDAVAILAALRRMALPKLAHLHILGGGDARCFALARQQAAHFGLAEGRDFTVWGKRPCDALAPMLRGCDLMLNLSYWDACPNVVIEAMACGLPVVGVNHGGLAELVGDAATPGKTPGSAPGGILVDEAIPFTWLDHQDPRRMPQAPIKRYAEAILAALTRREALSLAARARAKALFDIRLIGDQYQAAAQALVSPPVAQPEAASCG